MISMADIGSSEMAMPISGSKTAFYIANPIYHHLPAACHQLLVLSATLHTTVSTLPTIPTPAPVAAPQPRSPMASFKTRPGTMPVHTHS